VRLEVEVLAWRNTAVRMEGKAFVGDKLCCEAVISCQLVNRAAPTPSA
jgi:3-hydroxyacyl-[acyl-carrier-protein] dehydratase